MDIVIRNSAGIDVHKTFVIAARRWLDADGRVQTETPL